MVRSVDNQPIYHLEKENDIKTLKDYDTIGVDYMIYVSLVCDGCNHTFNREFPIVSNYTTGDNLALNTILQSLEPTSDLYKSLKKVIKSLGNVINNDELSTQPIKTNTMCKIDYSVYEVVQSLRTIEASEEMTAELRKEYGTDFDMIKACIKDRLIKPEAIGLIKKLAPICYKISGKVFLKGDSCGEHDFIGDGLDFKPVIELFDMTTEVNTGESYSFYVSTTAHFQLATTEEMIIVKNYLNNLK